MLLLVVMMMLSLRALSLAIVLICFAQFTARRWRWWLAHNQFGDVPDRFGSTLTEDDLHARVQIFGVFDEAKVHTSLVPRSQALFTHGQYLSGLTNVATVDCGGEKRC